MFTYNQWYRRYGVRNQSQLMSPPLPLLEHLELPRESIIHYVADTTLEVGPRNDEFLFRNVQRPMWILHERQLHSFNGKPIKLAIPLDSEIRQYHSKHRRYRMARSLEQAMRETIAPTICNYAFLPRMYRYQRSLFADYNRWYNIASTIWQRVGDLAAKTDRQQFVEIKLPRLLPGLTDLRIASESLIDGELSETITSPMRVALEETGAPLLPGTDEGYALESLNTRSLKIFHSPESLMLLELWKWAGEMRFKSIFDYVKPEHLGRVNLLFIESGRWFVLNLGIINNWRIATEQELEKNPDLNTKGLPPLQFQKRLLRLCMTLFQVRNQSSASVVTEPVEIKITPENSTETGTSNNEPTDSTTDNGVTVQDQEEQFDAANINKEKEDEKIEASTQSSEIKKPSTLQTKIVKEVNKTKTQDPLIVAGQAYLKQQEQQNNGLVGLDENLGNVDEKIDTGEDIKIDAALDAEIDKDLEELDRITKAHLEAEENRDESFAIEENTEPEHGVQKVCERLAQDGLLSAAEYRRYNLLAQQSRQIVSPDGKTSLYEFHKVDPEIVKITKVPEIKNIPTVIDKTMLKSSLLEFDQKYIKDVMEKDIASMVMALQNAGVCVTDYQVESVDSVLGSYKMYTVRVIPVEGAASTLRFRLPVLDENGSYYSGGSHYRLRKQKGSLPIHKTAPDSIALTSYYGKVFITRSNKKVNDYGAWLRNEIMALGLDKSNDLVQEVHPGDVFDPDIEVPRLYSQMAMGFRGFTLSPKDLPRLHFSFDYRNRWKTFGQNLINDKEADGRIVCGIADDKRIITMAKNGDLYLDNLPIPTFETLVQLDPYRAPIDFVQVKILGRNIPLGLILGYELGLEKLCRFLKVKPRRVPAGTRIGLEPHEYALVFADESLVFSKHDRFATMILAGFNEYHKSLRDYPSFEFDKRGVYLNVLESQGQSQRYLREIDLLYQMFIDPITKELLVQMKEPKTFQGLLLRSTQLLMTDSHPNELDPAHMRIKGYERMAGALYGELIKSLRIHNSHLGKAKYPIDLNPYAVWLAIQTDPAKMQVVEINPIEDLKDIEAVTFSGTGGRNSRTLVKRHRKYHIGDMGTISEATKDSSDTGVNIYTSADPQFTSLRGMSRPYDLKKADPTSLLSTSALTAPASDRDD